MNYKCPDNIPYPNRVDIQPNGWNIGCFWLAVGEDLEAELEGSELSAYQEALITEISFDNKLVLILGKGGEEIMSCLDEFNINYPSFFYDLYDRLPFIPDNYAKDIIGWELSKNSTRSMLSEKIDPKDPPF
ncbi:MAG: hypothetical protein AB4080_16955 [Trichodesmium sp.]